MGARRMMHVRLKKGDPKKTRTAHQDQKRLTPLSVYNTYTHWHQSDEPNKSV